MQYQEQQRVLKLLRQGLEQKTSADAGGIMRAPVTDFTCRELLIKEQEVFFRHSPLLLGMSTDLPDPGSYLATTETGVPILLTRDAENRFHAFLNACSHRGVRLVADGRGTRSHFTCPFHAWTYKNSGDLVAINRESSFGFIAKDSHGLVELPAQEQFGMLWVRPSPGAPFDLEKLLGGLAPEMEAWQIPDHDFAEEQVIHANINWKLAIDTFGENYHFDVLHRDTLASDIYGNLQTHDIYNLNYRMVFASKPGFKYADDNKSPIEKWPYRWITLNAYFLYPNVIMLVDPAGIDLLRMYPDEKDPARSRTHHSYYLNPELRDRAGNEPFESRFPGFNQIIVDEDYAMAESIQASANSGGRTHYLFGRNEPALHHYHNAHRRGLGMPQLKLDNV